MSTSLFLTGWLLTRFALVKDRPLGTPTLVVIGAAQTAMAFLAFGLVPITGGVALLALLLLAGHERWFSSHLLAARLATAVIMIAAVLAAHAAGAVPQGPVPGPQWQSAAWIAFGFLVVANEINLAIRLLFRMFDLEPREAADTAHVDEREYNAGRVIGILERWLIYSVLTVSNEYTVIALVLAAKGFARFRQLDQRPFAEYVLIGTLASTLFTVWVAQAIRLLLEA